MTIGSQLRDIYIEALEDKSANSPIVGISDTMLEGSDILRQMVTEAAGNKSRQTTKENFTVHAPEKGEPTMWAMHVYARALRGESKGGKQRAATLQQAFEKRHEAGLMSLQGRKFSKDPKRNVGKTPEECLATTPAPAAEAKASGKQPEAVPA